MARSRLYGLLVVSFCFWHETDMPTQSLHVRYQGINRLRSDASRGLKLTQIGVRQEAGKE